MSDAPPLALGSPTRIATLARRFGPAVLVLAGQGLQSAASFLTGILIARFASVSALGDYALGMTVMFLTASMAETLVATPFTYHVLRRRALACQAMTFGAGLALTLLLCLGSGALFGGLALFVPSFAPLFPALPAAIAMGLTRELIRRRHYAHGEPMRALVSDIIAIGLQFAIVVGMIHFDRFDAAGVFAASATACLIASAVGLADMRGQVRLRVSLLGAYARRFLGYGHWLALGGAAQILAAQSFSWFLAFAVDTRATGAFSACLALSSLPNPFLVGLTNYARPAIIRAYAQDGWAALLRQTLWLGLAFVVPVVLFAAVLIAAGGTLLALVYGPDLAWAAGALSWTVLALIALAVGAPLQLLMLAIHRPQSILWLHVGELVATYAIGLPLVLALGLYGAAIGYLVSAVAGAAVLCAFVAQEWRRRSAG